ncbi:MAG: type II toxin-antitoxin system HicA family toxin [Desulfobacteraceae bacterium]|jgi:predicted RNA binding protein YcfA (HicA-like mRNA interferase family)|nr:type II toxin-antitoxin system HicA family toxin [Desulfobacteraceae bacterium]
MLELPIISGKEAIKIFGSLGFKIVRQKGSHAVLRKENKGCVIPIHKELAIGTLRSAIKQAGITIEEFIDAYKNR